MGNISSKKEKSTENLSYNFISSKKQQAQPGIDQTNSSKNETNENEHSTSYLDKTSNIQENQPPAINEVFKTDVASVTQKAGLTVNTRSVNFDKIMKPAELLPSSICKEKSHQFKQCSSSIILNSQSSSKMGPPLCANEKQKKKSDRFKCIECKKTFCSKGSVSRHNSAVHLRIRPYKCDECGKAFAQTNVLRYHQLIHTGELPFKCSECQQGFRSKSKLGYHLHVHVKEKLDKGNLNEKEFAELQQLIYLAKEKIHKCDRCEKAFSKKRYLVQHLRVHTGEKPFKCEKCQKAYSSEWSLVEHRRNCHTGEKPYKCDQCEKAFATRKKINYHKRVHHKENKNDLAQFFLC